MTRPISLLAIAAAGLVASAQPPGSPAQAGTHCYALMFGRWTYGTESLSLYTPLPDGIALTDSLFWPGDRGHPAEYRAVRLRAAGPDGRGAFWQRAARDSMIIALPSWWSTGILISLAPSGDMLVGRANVYVDYSPVDPTYAAVTARREPCPAVRIG